MEVNPRGQGFSLQADSVSISSPGTTGAANIGNVYTLGKGQILPIVPDADHPRPIYIYNEGAIAVTISSAENAFPNGIYVAGADFLEIVTAAALFAAAPAPPRVYTATALVIPNAQIVVSVGY